jgi:hypothetical protein
VSGEAFRLIQYDLGATLSAVYSVQERVADNVDRLANGALATTDTFDPDRRAASTRLLWLTVADILAAERLLLKRYRASLPSIRAASSLEG